MADPWESDQLVGESQAAAQPAAPAEDAPWNNDRGVYGSGGVEDDPNAIGAEDPALPFEDGSIDPETGAMRVNIVGGTHAPETSATGAIGRGAIDTATLGFGDEGFAGAEALYRKITQDADFDASYDEALARNRGLAKADEDQHPYARIAGQLLGGVAMPVGFEGIGMRAGFQALKAGASLSEARAIAAATAASRSGAARLAANGAIGGAVYGAGSGEDASQRLLGAGVGAVAGAGGGAVLGAAGDAIAPALAARSGARAAARGAATQDARDVATAAERQGIDLLPADVGGPSTRRLTAAAAQAPLSASPIINRAQQVLRQGQAVAERAAGPTATDAAAAGEAARAGAQAYIARTGRVGGGLYDRAARRAGDATIEPVEARRVLDEQIQRLEAVPGGGQGIEEARAMRDALDGRFSVQGIRDMRTEMFVAPELRGSPMERRMRQVVDAAAQDVETGLRQQGHGDAAAAFRTADTFWRDRLATIDQVIEPVIGQPGKAKGGEAISKAIDTAAKGDVVKLQRFMGTLPADQREMVTGSMINRIGLATKGQQNGAGDAFSLSTFLSNWSQMSPRARAVLFNPEQRAALEDLATVAGGVREASRYANHSNTSGGIWGNLGVLAGAAAASPVSAGAGLATQLISGRLLASPRFARWLARAPRTGLSEGAYIDRLSRIAKAEPAIANDILDVQRRLQQP